MQIYLINLARAPERLARISALLEAQAINFVRVEAIDGKVMEDATYQQLTTPDTAFRKEVAAYCARYGRKSFLDLKEPVFDRILTKGELACFMSHRACLKRIAEGQDPYGVVLEDDFVMSPHAALFLKDWHWIPPGIDMVKLDRWHDPCLVGTPQPLTHGYSLRRLFTRNYAATGYIISKSCAELLYRLTRYATLAIDVLYFDPDCGVLSFLNIQQFYPALLVQIGLESCIEDRQNRAKPRLGPLQIIKRECERIKVKHRFLWRLLSLGRSRWGVVPYAVPQELTRGASKQKSVKF